MLTFGEMETFDTLQHLEALVYVMYVCHVVCKYEQSDL